jgi:hypothetical protein
MQSCLFTILSLKFVTEDFESQVLLGMTLKEIYIELGLFTFIEGGGKAKCVACECEFVCSKNSYKSLNRHLERKHPNGKKKFDERANEGQQQQLAELRGPAGLVAPEPWQISAAGHQCGKTSVTASDQRGIRTNVLFSVKNIHRRQIAINTTNGKNAANAVPSTAKN